MLLEGFARGARLLSRSSISVRWATRILFLEINFSSWCREVRCWTCAKQNESIFRLHMTTERPGGFAAAEARLFQRMFHASDKLAGM